MNNVFCGEYNYQYDNGVGCCSSQNMANCEYSPEQLYSVWYELRRPFAVPTTATNTHKCVWEIFSTGQAGCLLCAKHHQCSIDVCDNVERASDGTFCTITGMCIKAQNLQINEFEDVYPTYMKQSFVCIPTENTNTILHDRVNEYLTNFLRLPYVVEQMDLFASLNRAQLFKMLSSSIYSLMCICKSKLNMKIKYSEVCSVTIGLLYMMRTGIRAHNICVLPQIPILSKILPAESMLIKLYNFRPKNITDVENKFKFHLRGVPLKKFQHLGLHFSVNSNLNFDM